MQFSCRHSYVQRKVEKKKGCARSRANPYIQSPRTMKQGAINLNGNTQSPNFSTYSAPAQSARANPTQVHIRKAEENPHHFPPFPFPPFPNVEKEKRRDIMLPTTRKASPLTHLTSATSNRTPRTQPNPNHSRYPVVHALGTQPSIQAATDQPGQK